MILHLPQTNNTVLYKLYTNIRVNIHRLTNEFIRRHEMKSIETQIYPMLTIRISNTIMIVYESKNYDIK
jgi:hypothetical protein